MAAAIESFEAARNAGRLAQAYLVVGNVRDEGIPFAGSALERLFCEGMIAPCGGCPACERVRARRHPDVVWIEPEKKSRAVGIERIRELQRLVYQTAMSGTWKAVVLVDADRLGEAAANAFLKTLEEPPAHCLFLLLSDSPQAIMATILSRCQRIVLSAELEALAEPWRGRLTAILSGSHRDGLTRRLMRAAAFAQLFDDIKKHVRDEEGENSGDAPADDDTVEARIESRFRELRSKVVRAMLFWYRDILVTVCGAEASQLCYREQAAAVAAAAQGMRYRDALANVRAIEAMQRRFDRNLGTDTVIHGAVQALTA
jgi:hypothetical protein